LQKGNSRRQVLIEALDQGLLTLGESGMKAIYFHIQNVTSVKKEDIPDNLEALQKGLEKIFGEGAKVIEAAIVRSLCQKLGIQYEEGKNESFVEKINAALKAAAIKS
jgi:protein-disulfide isomerase-like protein with CxxC motif